MSEYPEHDAKSVDPYTYATTEVFREEPFERRIRRETATAIFVATVVWPNDNNFDDTNRKCAADAVRSADLLLDALGKITPTP